MRIIKSCQCPLLQPVHVEQALRKQPRAADLNERIFVAQRSDHQSSLCAVDGEVMRQAVCFPRASISRQAENGTLANEVHCRGVLVQIREHWSKRLTRMQFL